MKKTRPSTAKPKPKKPLPRKQAKRAAKTGTTSKLRKRARGY